MKKIIIRCILNNSLLRKYRIIIFNKCHNKVFDQYTLSTKTILYLNKGVYKVVIIPLHISSQLITSFIVNDKNNYYNLCFKENDSSLIITATLVDKNYNNLPIERGEIKLWQNHTQ